MSGPETIGGALDAIVEQAARSYAQRWRLVSPDGLIWCANCKVEPALMPSLHCGRCLGTAYVRLHIVVPCCVNRAQGEPVAAPLPRQAPRDQWEGTFDNE